MVQVPPGWHRAAGGWAATGIRNWLTIGRPAARQPYSAPPHAYFRRYRVPIPNAIGQTVVAADGTAQVKLGPQASDLWHVTMVNVTTTTGAFDPATAIVYFGVLDPSRVAGTSIAGGQDTIGMNAPPLQVGDSLVVAWSGGNPGDIATAVIHGWQDTLIGG